MECEEFWESLSNYWGEEKELPEELNTHLKHCPKCRSEFEDITSGIFLLKEEIEKEELSLRQEIREELRKRLRINSPFFKWGFNWRFGLAITVVFLLLMVVFISPLFHKKPSLEREDIFLLVGGTPNITWEEVNLSDFEEENEAEAMRGISDPWISLLDEVQKIKQRRDGYEKISNVINLHFSNNEYLLGRIV